MMAPGGRSAGDGPLSVMFYCHDAYGIGHLKRALTLGRYLSTRWPGMTQLIVSSSAMVPALGLEERADYVKLPSVKRVVAGEGDPGYVSRVLPIPVAELREMRRDMLLGVVRHFHPDLLVVDYLPAGLAGELAPSLRHLKTTSPRTRLVAGLRDIVGDPTRVREAWARDGVYELLENLYDRILVYGQPDIYDVAGETGLSPGAAAKIRYTGYLGQEPGHPSPREMRGQLGLQTGRLVLVTAGGGADGYAVFQAMLEARRRWPERARFDCVLVGGPLMPSEDRRRLEAQASRDSATRFIDHVNDLRGHIGAADVVVSRGGYNTICEILSFSRPAVIVPREAIDGVEDREQLMRAQALSQRGLVRVIRQPELTPEGLLEAINGLLEAPAGVRKPLALGGLPVVAAELEGILGRRVD